MKRILSVLLTIIVLMSLSVPAFAATGPNIPLPTVAVNFEINEVQASRGDAYTDAKTGLEFFVPESWELTIKKHSYLDKDSMVKNYRVFKIVNPMTGASVTIVESTVGFVISDYYGRLSIISSGEANARKLVWENYTSNFFQNEHSICQEEWNNYHLSALEFWNGKDMEYTRFAFIDSILIDRIVGSMSAK